MQTFKLLPHDSVMLLQPVLVKNFGKSGALLLSQLHYWLTKKEPLGCNHQGDHWIYNTAEEWADQLQLSARYVRHLFATFVDLGIVKVAKLHKIKSVRTNYYSIDYARLNNFIGTTSVKEVDSSAEIITAPLGKNNLMYVETKTTIKDFNKSEGLEQNVKVVWQGDQVLEKASQVEQVKILNLENKKVLEGKVSVLTDETVTLRDPANSTALTPSLVKTSTTQDMLKAWNQHFADLDSNKSKARLSKETAPLLVAAFKTKFESNLANWQDYCEQIKSSPYLMGDSFKLTLGWALKYGTIDRIRAGDLGVKITQTQISSRETLKIQEENVDQAIEALPENSSLKAIRRQIAKAIGSGHYLSWFHPAEFFEADGKISMKAPSAFVQGWWETHYDKILELVENGLKLVTLDQPSAGEHDENNLLTSGQNQATGQGGEAERTETKDLPLLSEDNKTYQKIESLPESIAVKALRHKIVQAIGDAAYNLWFHQAQFCEIDGGIRLIAPNYFVEQYWVTHFDWVKQHNDDNSQGEADYGH